MGNSKIDMTEIEAKLFSKVIFLDYHLEDKLIDNKVVVHIIYDDYKNRKIAKIFKKLLDKKKIYSKIFQAKTYNFKKISEVIPTFYIIVMFEKNLKTIFPILLERKRLIFGYYENLIKYCTMTLALESKVKLAINVDVIRKTKIELKPIIFKVAKSYESD